MSQDCDLGYLFLLICLCVFYLEANLVNTFKHGSINTHNSDYEQEERNTNVRRKLAWVFPADNEANESCTLPDEKIGRCINLKNCSYALNLLKKQKQPKICRFDGEDPIVCCPPTITKLGIIINSQNISDHLEYCTLSDGQKGTCVNIRHCRYAQERLHFRKRVQVCYLEEENLVACCLKKSGDISLRKCDYYYPTEPPRPAIYIGTPSLATQFPYMAAIGFGNESNIEWGCGGTLISEKFILTAAHCLYSQHLGPAKYVRLGDLDLSIDTDDAEPQNYTIKRRISHPDYKPPLKYHDIALLELGSPVRRTDYVDIACLNTDRFYIRNFLEAMGWGKTEYAGDPSSILLRAYLDVVPQDECQTSYRKDTSTILPKGIVDDLMICAGGQSDTCQGDSGGPLVTINPRKLTNKQVYNVVGVTAFGQPCGTGKSPGVYTRVSHYLEWIENTVWPNETLSVTNK